MVSFEACEHEEWNRRLLEVYRQFPTPMSAAVYIYRNDPKDAFVNGTQCPKTTGEPCLNNVMDCVIFRTMELMDRQVVKMNVNIPNNAPIQTQLLTSFISPV